MGEFRWSGRREQAALLVAEDRLTNAEIAAKVGVSRQALDKWKADPEFRGRVKANVDQLSQAVLEVGIHDRSCRVAALEDRWRRLLAVIDACVRQSGVGSCSLSMTRWATGVRHGTANRLKFLKSQIYGRASLDLL